MRTMTALIALLCALTLTAACASSGNAPNPEQNRSAGEVVDDATLTARVKARLLDDPVVQGMQIDVDTINRVVMLTGTVNNEDEKKQAIKIARETPGVKDVRADLDVRGT